MCARLYIPAVTCCYQQADSRPKHMLHMLGDRKPCIVLGNVVEWYKTAVIS